MIRQSINEQITTIQEFDYLKENIWWVVGATIIAGLVAFFIFQAMGKHKLHEVFLISLSYAFGSALLALIVITNQSIGIKSDMRQDLNERMLQNVEDNVAFDDIIFLDTKHRGEVRVATFQALNDSEEYIEFQMTHNPEYDMMLPYGELASEDIPVLPSSELENILQ